MTEAQKSEVQISDRVQPIGGGSEMVGGPVDAVDERVKVEFGTGVSEVVKRRRGRPPKAAPAKPPPAKPAHVKPPTGKKIKEEDEDVCFICFDGGSLVLCDHRGCPKAYHPACIKRDEEFFESAAKWTCGWHICSICQKTSHHMCYTCTYSLCRGCIRKADYVCVRGDKGFCTICMKTIMLIENNGQGEDGKVQADFDDKLSWEYLFKVYWLYLKGKLSLTVDELTQAKNPWKEAGAVSSTAVVHNIAAVSCSTTSTTSVGGLEETNESKRRKIDEHGIGDTQKGPVNIEKSRKPTIGCGDWASKELLDFVSHVNGNKAVLSCSDVRALLTDYIKRNNLRDPINKNQIICDSRLESLFGKPRVGRIQMLKLLEHHFAVKEDSRKRRVRQVKQVNCTAVDPDWDSDSMLTVGRDRKRKSNKVEDRAVHNKLDEFAAVDGYNMNLIYLRRDLMANLLEDNDNFHDKVVGSLVRIKISGCALKHDMYRLVQVIGTSRVDVPYTANGKVTDIMLEVLNLDKKETITIDAISEQEFSEEERKRLQHSIRCGIVKHFTVGEIQEKAMALQSVKLNDLMQKEILRLNNLRDKASAKGHKKSFRECVEKIQRLKTPEERERRLNQMPLVHSDPKLNPDYESDDTEEYFNKEHGDQKESKRKRRSRKVEKPVTKTVTKTPSVLKVEKPVTKTVTKTPSVVKVEKPINQPATKSPNVEPEPTPPAKNDASGSIMDKNSSTATKLDEQTTLSSSVSNTAPEPLPSVPQDTGWHYLDPNGKVQGPFSLVLLQRWSASGYFSADMTIWANHEDTPVLLADVLKQHFQNYGNIPAATNKVGVKIDCLDPTPTPYVPDTPNPEKLSDSQSFGQNWSGNNSDNHNNQNYNPPSVESTVHLDTSNTPTLETEKNEVVPAGIESPGPAPDTVESLLDSKVLVHDSAKNNPPSWGSASSLVVGGPKLPDSGNGLAGCGLTAVKSEKWDPGFVLEVAGDQVATPTSNVDQNADLSHQPGCNDFTTWPGVGEMIELSALSEESVSDLLAEVDAMESQYGQPSPTSRRNSFVEDLFNDSFDEFSPAPDQGTRSDGFSSSGDIQLPCQSATIAAATTAAAAIDEHRSIFDFMKTSNSLQQHSFAGPNLNGQTGVGSGSGSGPGSVGFKWREMERAPQEMIDINRSAKAEGDEGENGNYNNIEHPKEDMQALKPIGIGAKLVTRVAQIKWLEGTANQRRGDNYKQGDGEFGQPAASLAPLSLGLDPYDPCDLGSETYTSPSGNIGWDALQQKYGGGGGGGGYWRPAAAAAAGKAQRVCRFYESGRCKKGESCKNLHP